MADEVNYYPHQTKSDEPCEVPASALTPKAEDGAVEASDRGLFGFVGKKEEEEKCDLGEDVIIVTEGEEKSEVCDVPKEAEKKHEGLVEKLHRSDSSSSSSSDEEEEVDENGEKKKKKKGLKETIKEKFSGKKKEEEEKQAEVKCEEDIVVPVEKCDIDDEDDEKKGFLDKIKEKLPGGKKSEEVAIVTPPPAEEYADAAAFPEAEGKEKKGFLEKIKEKLPGYHSKSDEEKEKEKEKVGGC